MQILTEPKNSIIKQYQKLFEMDNVNLSFSDEAMGEVASKALVMKTGARGLRAILESVMLEIMYDLPDKAQSFDECQIDANVIKGEGEPTFIQSAKRESA